MAERLREAMRKLEWADQHVEYLEREIQRMSRDKAESVRREDDPDSVDHLRWVLPSASLGDELRLIVGDAVHNLRTALDYLADLLVRVGGGTPDEYTAFPIWRKGTAPNGQQYKSLLDRKVRGAASGVVRAFERMEPYEGGKHELLWALDKLDILDKHRLLLVVAIRVQHADVPASDFPDVDGWAKDIAALFTLTGGRMGLIRDSWAAVPLIDGEVLHRAKRSAYPKPEDDPKFSFNVALGEPKILQRYPVVPAIAQMRNAVEQTIAAFRPDLGPLGV